MQNSKIDFVRFLAEFFLELMKFMLLPVLEIPTLLGISFPFFFWDY